MDDLRDLILNSSKNQDTFAHSMRTQLKGMRAHLEDLETWKKDMNSQMANLVERIPRQHGRLPGHPDENPKGSINAVTLRSGKVLPGEEEKQNDEEITQDSSSPVRQDPGPSGAAILALPKLSTTMAPDGLHLAPSGITQAPSGPPLAPDGKHHLRPPKSKMPLAPSGKNLTPSGPTLAPDGRHPPPDGRTQVLLPFLLRSVPKLT